MKHWDYHPNVRSGKDRTVGERAADAMRLGMGSWAFVFCFTCIMGLWMWWNSTAKNPFDPFPFILLNLALSTLAGLQGAILLIAAKRADRIAADLAKYHLEVSEESRRDLEYLKQLTQNIHHLMGEMDLLIKQTHTGDTHGPASNGL